MIARILRISLVITLLFVSWISTGFLKLVRENGIYFNKFEERIAIADVGGGTASVTFGTGDFQEAATATGEGPGGVGAGPGEAGSVGSAGEE